MEKELSAWPPLPPIPSQWVTSVPTTPVVPVYSEVPSELGEEPITWLPLPVPVAWLIPPPEIRPLLQSAWVEISEFAVEGPLVAPGVFTVTATVLAKAAAGKATASAAPRTRTVPVVRVRTDRCALTSTFA
ncbi:hypothetical protein FRACA_1980004 [Frankia canadensis]|uniref:Uncharacterized protein n=1 Tax=Frankia canadensis TaxID=1836972 RepID=A0A2I2KPK0_9ACTN|nr:hypothetical protein FRACA_1980004 [Frankia canadensis]SOU54876.1 hypothetical protein FRACA_1980004 [Frankia canadensis]